MGCNTAEPISKEEAVDRINEKCPGLLLQDESDDMGFKAIRDRYYFTSHRVLIEDKQGVSGKRVEYKSCPYQAIKAFSVEMAGSADSEVELKIYGESLDLNIVFKNKKVDLVEIQKYLSRHVFVDSIQGLLAFNEPSPQKTGTGDKVGDANALIDYLSGVDYPLAENVLETELKNIGAVVDSEKVKLAFKCGKNMLICTSDKMLYIDTQGHPERKIEYLSMRYSCIKAYSVETPGSFLDTDSVFKIFTNISQEKRCISTNVTKELSDIMEILWYFNNQLLGMDTMSKDDFAALASVAGDNKINMSSWLGDEMCQIDASEINTQFHTSPPLLQWNEVCEIAFKGQKDLVLFTDKRILFVDKECCSGGKISFTSFPYSSIKMFQVTTAGTLFDKDFELGFYSEIWYDPPKCNGCGNACGDEGSHPGMSFIEFDINKKD